jgi:hypothetical protein
MQSKKGDGSYLVEPISEEEPITKGAFRKQNATIDCGVQATFCASKSSVTRTGTSSPLAQHSATRRTLTILLTSSCSVRASGSRACSTSCYPGTLLPTCGNGCLQTPSWCISPRSRRPVPSRWMSCGWLTLCLRDLIAWSRGAADPCLPCPC